MGTVDTAASVSFTVSELLADREWDDFLLSTEGGRHEQLALWTSVKVGERWMPKRCVARDVNGDIAGGFQLLWRRGRGGGRIGYVSFGPLAAAGREDLADVLVEQLREAARDCRLHAVLVQPPVGAVDMAPALERAGCLPNRIRSMARGTAILDLADDEEALLRRMRRTRRQEIRRSLRSGLVLREGGPGDLPEFFRLMCLTCARQKTSPNPGSLDALQRLWDTFRPRGLVRLFLAEQAAEVVASLLVIPFGSRCILWKIGWSGEHADLHPNNFLYWSVIRWAKQQGFRDIDFLSIDPGAARKLADNEPGAEALRRTPTFYKLGFAPAVIAFPPSLLYLPNPGLRLAYRCLLPILRRRACRPWPVGGKRSRQKIEPRSSRRYGG